MSCNPINITPYSFNSIGAIIARTAGTAMTGATSASLTANQAYFYPFWLEKPFQIQTAFLLNGASVTGNIDIGVYTPEGTRLCSIGATAQAGTNAIQSAALSYRLGPGNYFLALGSSSTGTCFSTTGGILRNITAGPMTQASGYSSGLIASATFASGAGTPLFIFGISRRSFI